MKYKGKIVIYLILLLIALGLVIGAVKTVNEWFDKHYLQFNRVVEIKFNKPVEIKERKIKVEEIVEVINEIPEPEGLDSPIEKYICEKFGVYDCKTAIAIARAESGRIRNEGGCL